MSLVLRNAGRLVTCDQELGEGPLGVIRGGALVAEKGRITWVGRDRDAKSPRGATELDAEGAAVLPGLVDCHTHLVFAGDRAEEFGARMRGEPYKAGGIRTTVAATRAAGDQELTALALARLDRFLGFGVTTVEAKTGYGLTEAEELRLLRITAALEHPVNVVTTLLAAHVIPPESDAATWIDAVCERVIPAARKLAEFSDVWCEPNGAFDVEQSRRVLEASRSAGLGLKVHAEQLGPGGGAALAAEMGATSADHLEHVTPADAYALADAGTVGVLMPGASMLTAAPYAPARMLVERGVRLALSTDFNPGTSYTENLQLMVALGCGLLKLTPEEALLGVTRNAAAAIGREDRCGRLKPGLEAAFVVLDSRSEVDVAYHYGVNLAATVVRGGEVAA